MFRRLLARATGYVVYGSDGRRIGTFVELIPRSEQRGDSVAIRCDGILLWRRRVVPVVAVAGVDPKERTVTLLLDQEGIERVRELQPDEPRAGWVADRVAHYGTAAAAGDTVDDVAFAQHVLFVPTAAGYVLIERRGAPPPCTGKIDLDDPPGSFIVVKLAESPLPNDARVCAYLERLD